MLADVLLKRGTPEHIRSDNGPEFIAMQLRQWLGHLEMKPLYIEPGSPWENGYCESFNGTLGARGGRAWSARARPRVAGERGRSPDVSPSPRYRVAQREAHGSPASGLAPCGFVAPSRILVV